MIRYDHTCKRNTDSGWRIPIVNNDMRPYDTTGWAARMDVRTAPDRDEGTLLFTLTDSDGLTFGTGYLDVHLSPAKKAALTEDTIAYYDVIVDPTGGARVPLYEGTILANDTVTDTADWEGAPA